MKNLLEENREEFIMDKQARMKELVEVLNQASKAYYQEDRELFSNPYIIQMDRFAENTTNYMMNCRH